MANDHAKFPCNLLIDSKVMALKTFYDGHMLTLINKAILSYQLHGMVKISENIF